MTRSISLLVFLTLAFSACAPGEPQELEIEAVVEQGVYLMSSFDVHETVFSTREYLPDALPNIQKFHGYAGHILSYIGEKNEAGLCADRSKATLEISTNSVMTDGAAAEDLEPNGISSEYFMVEESEAGVGVLPFFQGRVSDKKSVHLLVQDVAHQSALNVLDDGKMAAAAAEALPGECDRRVVTTAVLTVASAKTFEESGRKAQAKGFNVKVDGRWHTSTTDFERELYLYVETRALPSVAE